MNSRLLALTCAILLAGALGLACGGDDDQDTVDAAAIDAVATVDAGIDATAATACDVLCNCAVANCSGFTMQTCLSDCAGLEASVTACRIEHCGYAKSNPTFHCPHVAGTPSTSTPQACIAN